MTTKPVYLSPFETIVGVGWGGVKRIVVLNILSTCGVSASGAPPSGPDVTVTLTVRTTSGEAIHHTLKLARPTGTPPAPPITEAITSEMLAYYAIWSFPPYVDIGAVTESTGGGFYFITPQGGVFNDFVSQPYSSVAAAEAYLEGQKVIHPEYIGETFIIDFFPPFDNFAGATSTFNAMVFVNLDAFDPLPSGTKEIDFAVSCVGDSFSGKFEILAILQRDVVANLDVTADAHDVLTGLGSFPVSVYDYKIATGFFVPESPQAGTIVWHPDDTLTGPPSIGGGGGG